MAPKKSQPERKAKKLCTESSRPPEPNYELFPRNRYLFRDDDAYQMFVRFTKRGLSGCFYFDSKGKIPNRYLTKINNWINHFSIGELSTVTDTFSDHTTRLFYANVRFNNMNNATSYFHGREIDLSLPKLATLLSMQNEGLEVYPHKTWPWDENHPLCQETVYNYRNWFNLGVDGKMYLTDIPGLHRVAFLLVNNILTPKSTIKTNIENGALFYMRHMIAMDGIEINIPWVLIRHMKKAYSNSKDSLPYGHLIHHLLIDQGIRDPLAGVPVDEHKQPQNILDYFSGWTKTNGDMLVPSSDDPTNEYLMDPNALPNQYFPVGGQAPEPREPPPRPQPNPTPQAAQTSSNVGYDQLMAYLTTQFQGINTRLDDFGTQIGEIKTQVAEYGTRLDGYNTRLTSLEKNMESGFKTTDTNIERCHTTVHKF